MAKRMMVSVRYGSHMPVLLQAYRRTNGAILELGGGVFSTHTLHWLCEIDQRFMTTLESIPFWYEWCMQYESPHHTVYFVDDWMELMTTGQWDVALVDLSPDNMRKEMIKKLADNTRYIVVHDTNGRYNKIYHYDEIYPLFKHRLIYDKTNPHTTILSNLVSLEDFWYGYSERGSESIRPRSA